MSTGHKSESCTLARLLICVCVLYTLICTVRADIMYRTVLPGQSFPGIDFDGDGAPELTFTSYALTTHSLESSGVLYMAVVCAENTQVLLDGGLVLPLGNGSLLSPSPSVGAWSGPLHTGTVWTFPFTSSTPSGTNVIVVGDIPVGEEPQQSIPRGVGMPGYGGFMGVRFQRLDAWHYAWVQFGVRETAPTSLPPLDLPSVLGFAYESIPGITVEVGSKPQAVLITGLKHVTPDYLRIQWNAHVGQSYHIETKRRLDWHAWSPMSFRITGVAETMMIDLPITEEAQFFRVIEAH